jgi:hypothetical protein
VHYDSDLDGVSNILTEAERSFIPCKLKIIGFLQQTYINAYEIRQRTTRQADWSIGLTIICIFGYLCFCILDPSRANLKKFKPKAVEKLEIKWKDFMENFIIKDMPKSKFYLKLLIKIEFLHKYFYVINAVNLILLSLV